MRTQKTKSTTCQTASAIATATGRDRRLVARIVKALPPERVEGGHRFYDSAKVRAILATIGDRTLPAEKRAKLLDEQIRKLQLANDAKQGALVPRAEVERAIIATATEVRAILRQRLENEYPGQVAGLDVPQARIYGKRLVDEVMVAIQGLDRFWK